MIKQEGLYQNKVNSSLGSIHNCKMAYLNWQLRIETFILAIQPM